MRTESAKKIIHHAVSKTQSRWAQYDTHWEDLDEIFIEKGYEQVGFEMYKMVSLFSRKGIYSIKSLGNILDKYN